MLAKEQRGAKTRLKDYVLLRIMERLERGTAGLRDSNSLCILGYPSESAQIHMKNY